MTIMRLALITLLLCLLFMPFPTGTAHAANPADKTTRIDRTIDEQLDKLVREIGGSMSKQQKWKIAVIEFSDINGQVSNLGKFISEELTTRLFSDGRFQMIERQLISKVLIEQKLSMTGLLDEKSTKKVGAILGVDFIVTGTIADLGTAFKINARTIAVDTGAVLSVASAVLPKNDQINQLAGTPGGETTDATSLAPAMPASRITSTAGAIVVKGRLLFDGRPLSDFTHAAASISIYSPTLGQWVTPAYDYDARTANFTIQVLTEDNYSCNAEVDANSANPRLYPGDYKGSNHFSAHKTTITSMNIDMERLIHLIKPENNGKPMVGWGAACFDKIRVITPVSFAWEPIEKDVYYTYTVKRTECDPFAIKELVAGDTTTDTNISLDLPVNREGEIYLLQITARKNGRNTGSLMTHGGNGWGWDYRFRVVK
jgi:curli biogenesis system outer membrane secretion channel CsgG